MTVPSGTAGAAGSGAAAGPGQVAAAARRQLAAGIMAVQAVAGVVLWVLLFTVKPVRAAFELSPDDAVTSTFFGADVVAIATSALGAWAAWTSRPWALVVAAFTAGAVVYPTVYLLLWVTASEGTGAVALAVMVPSATLSLWATWLLWRSRT